MIQAYSAPIRFHTRCLYPTLPVDGAIRIEKGEDVGRLNNKPGNPSISAGYCRQQTLEEH